MLSSIHPLGERARNNRYWVTVAAYAIGSVAGGVVLGLAAEGLGALLHTGGPPSLLAGCLLYTSPSPRDISGSRMPSSA